MTPGEFLARAAGAERTWERLARLVAWIAQANYKDALTSELLLWGRPRPRR